MTCAALALCAMLDISGTSVTLGPADVPQAEAMVVMRNALSNSDHDNAVYTLAWGGMIVQVRFTWDAVGDADRITVTPPYGMTCEPRDCTATVAEMNTGTVYLLPFNGF